MSAIGWRMDERARVSRSTWSSCGSNGADEAFEPSLVLAFDAAAQQRGKKPGHQALLDLLGDDQPGR
jgi:hypothetical protein